MLLLPIPAKGDNPRWSRNRAKYGRH